MTVYHAGEPVEVLGGNVDENWAIVQYLEADDEQHRDVHLREMGAEGGYEEIADAIERRATYLGETLPARVRVRYPNNKLIIETSGGTTLREFDFLAAEEEQDGYTFVTETVMPAIKALDMAHRQPTRVLWRNRDKLED